MPYDITCQNCGEKTRSANIVRLLDYHVTIEGKLRCPKCKSTNAGIYRVSKLQEEDQHWERWIEAVIRLSNNPDESYQPYVFLTAGQLGGPIHGIHFGYYKDLRENGKGKLKHGHGPGGAPVLNKEMLLRLLRQLGSYGIVSAEELEDVASDLRSKDAV